MFELSVASAVASAVGPIVQTEAVESLRVEATPVETLPSGGVSPAESFLDPLGRPASDPATNPARPAELVETASEVLSRLEEVKTAGDSGSASIPEACFDELDRMEGERASLDQFITAFVGGARFEQGELLAIQIRAQMLKHDIELLTKAIELAHSGTDRLVRTNI